MINLKERGFGTWKEYKTDKILCGTSEIELWLMGDRTDGGC